MGLDQYGLRCESRYIRDILAPLVASSGGSILNEATIYTLDALYFDLRATSMSLEMLRFSRIEKALMVIAKDGSDWPHQTVVQAEELIQQWEDKLGPLTNLRADLWGVGGRLEGIRKIRSWRDGLRDRDEEIEEKSSWSIEGLVDPSRAYVTGHLGFEIGSWWIKPAAAFRDGIIDNTTHGITTDRKEAYAVVITDNREFGTRKPGVIGYRASPKDPGVTKLMRTLITRNPVRVLRTAKLVSTWAPAAGVRYDGLHRVVSYGVHLAPAHNGVEETMTYSFELERSQSQHSMTKAMIHPTADEMDDWKDYQFARAMSRGDDVLSLLFGERLEEGVTTYEEHGLRKLSSDSGYFSRRTSRQSSSGV